MKEQLGKIKDHNFGFIKIKPTNNNIFITLTDLHGNVLITKKSGLLNFKGAKKKTPYVAGEIIKNLFTEIEESDLTFKVFVVQITGYIRSGMINSAIKKLDSLQLANVIYLEYVNKKIHNGGLRAKKQRRL